MMAKTLGQILSNPKSTDEQIREAIRAATKKERDDCYSAWLKLCKPHVYRDLLAQAQKNVRLLQEKVK